MIQLINLENIYQKDILQLSIWDGNKMKNIPL